MLTIEYSKQAVKFLTKADRKVAKQIMDKIDEYAENPTAFKNKVKKLTNSPYYRLRVGDYRVIFTETGEILKIEKIGHRKDVY